MEVEDEEKLHACVEEVIRQDRYLLQHDISERAIAHRLALYLTLRFPDFDVDCEYNGNIDADRGRKYLTLLKDRARELGRTVPDNAEDMTTHGVYPDIIVHKRGLNGRENNLLVVELKKSSNPDNGGWDAEKLCRFTSCEYENRFDYRLGAFVKFEVGEEIGSAVDWYQNGEMVPQA